MTPRIIRAYVGHHTTTSASIALRKSGPSAAAIASARMIGGKARKTSVTRITVSSTRPPRYPAAAPVATPITAASVITITPTGIEIRAL